MINYQMGININIYVAKIPTVYSFCQEILFNLNSFPKTTLILNGRITI